MWNVSTPKSTVMPRVIAGRNLAHQRLNARQRTVIAAVAAPAVPSPWATSRRWDASYEAAMADAPVTVVTSTVDLPDSYLLDLVRAVGVDRILNIARQVEQQAAA